MRSLVRCSDVLVILVILIKAAAAAAAAIGGQIEFHQQSLYHSSDRLVGMAEWHSGGGDDNN